MRFPHLNYVTLDDLDLLDFAQKDPKGFILSQGEKVVLDEIQRASKLTIAVKNEIDQKGKTFLMTVSSSLGLLNFLAGRINILNSPTCCWGEEEGPFVHKIFDNELNPLEIKENYRKPEEVIKFGGF